MDKELQQWIQENTASRVTDKFVQTLRQIAHLHNSVSKFIGGAKALGKFRDKDDFLKELYAKFQSESGPVIVETPKKPGQSVQDTKSVPVKETTKRPLGAKKKKFSLKLQFDEESDDSDQIETLDIKPIIKREKNVIKRISKESAARKNEFSKDVKITKPGQVAELIPGLPDDGDSVGAESDSEETPFLKNPGEDVDTIVQDREWYNNDDDFENLIHDNEYIPAFKDGVDKERNYDASEPDIQLTSLTLSERKSIIPPFLLDLNDASGESAIVGAMELSSRATGAIISSVRNPESEFSVNARRGSRLVAMRRLLRDRKDKSKSATKLEGSKLGSLLGIKNEDSKEHPGNRSQPESYLNETETWEQLQAVRRSLPAYKVRNDLLQAIRDNQVTIVIGETGSGKTTQLAQFLHEDGYTSGNKMIGCTQPRRVAAVSVAERVAAEMNTVLGQKVGYAIRFEDHTSEDTKIKFMTDGILLRETMIDSFLDKYSCIIMDEAHERSLNTDVLLGIFKTLLARKHDLKLIVTSATMNADKFSRFFGNAPQFYIPGKTFPVEINYTNHPVSDYVDAAVQKALDIHLSTPVRNGDILIFMTGQEDIEATCSSILERLTEIYNKKYGSESESRLNDVSVLPIYSSLPADVQGKIFQRQEADVRKIVVATNIAETSLTVDGIKYVIDCGYSKLKVYNPRIGLDSLRVTPISLANANQRSGRAGRTGPGVAYRLYTQDTALEDMYPQAIPEVQRTNLANTLLQLKSLNIENVLDFPFIDQPPIPLLMTSSYDLWALGALDNFGRLTSLGRLMSAFPLQPFLTKILISSSTFHCSEEMLTIVSMLSVPNVFYRPKEREEESDQARNRFLIAESDHLTLLNVYSQWRANKYSPHWCNSHFLQFRSLVRAKDIRDQLKFVMKKQNLPVSSTGSDWTALRKCLCTGYIHQTAKLSGLAKYIHLKTGMDLKVHPTSALFGHGDLPGYVIYHELVMTSNEYINVVTAVDPMWVMEYGGLFYHIRRLKDVAHQQPTNNSSDLSRSPENAADLDRQIDKLKESASISRKKLLTDTVAFKVYKNHLKAKQTPESDVSTPSVSIGIKRRRPL